jgi:hypothetical protein
MKHKFTKLMAIIAVLLMSAWSVNAQTSIYPGTFPLVMTGYDALLTNPKAAGWMINSSTTPSNTSRTDKCFTGSLAEVNMNSGRFLQYRLPNCKTITISCDGTSGRGFWITAKDASNNSLSVTRTEIISGINDSYLVVGAGTGNSGTCTTMSFDINTSEEVFLKIYSPLSGEVGDGISGAGSTYISNITITENIPLTPSITKFVAEGVEATINESAKTITAELPYGTSLTSITPEVTLGGTATSYGPPGAQDFSNSVSVPVVYTVSDDVNEVDYSVTLTASQTASSEKDLSNVMIGGKTPTFDAGTNTYSVMLPKSSSLMQAVTFTKPSTATADFTTGNTHDFTNPLQITVTAQDASTKIYTLTAAVGNKNIAYIINTAVSATDTKIRPELAKTNYIENIQIGTVTTSTDFSMYDLVILTEAPSSGSTGMKALWGINKPLLSLKIFALNSNTWDKGTQANPAAPASTIATVYEPNHPIFSGISLTGAFNNEIVSIGAITTGNGLQTSNYSGNYLIGGVGTSPAIIEFPINTPAGATATGYKNLNLIEKLLVLGISDNNQDKLTADGLKLVTNAVNYLTGTTTWGINAGTDFQSISFTGNAPIVGLTSATIAWQAVPAAVKYIVTQVTPSGVKGVSKMKSAINVDVPGNETTLDLTGLSGSTSYQFNVAAENAIGKLTDPAIITFSTWFTGVSSATLEGVNFDGRTIQNPDRQQLHVFDATGRLLLTSHEDINMSAHAKGVYLVKGENGLMKIAVTK